MKIGVCFGGYCPLHRGHLDQIMKAKKENDLCYVIPSGTGNTRRESDLGLTLEERTALIKVFFQGDELVKVFSVNEDDINLEEVPCIVRESLNTTDIMIKYPDGLPENMPTQKDRVTIRYNNWVKWLDYVENKIKKDNPSEEIKTTYYVGEHDYKGFINSILGRNATKIMTRSNISGTQIRKDPEKYWSYIATPFRKCFMKKILIIGPASEGKTTLCEDLGRYYNLPVNPEFGRIHMETHGLKDTDLTIDLMKEFMERQNLYEEGFIDEACIQSEGVVICDSDVHTTLMYAKAYINDSNIPGITKDGYEEILVPLMNELKRSWDLIILIPPHAKFVDDGLRYMKQSSLDERWKNYKFLLEILKKDYSEDIIKILPLDGSYYDNFLISKDYVEKFINK